MKVKVIGHKFSETATYYNWDSQKLYPTYEMVDTQEWEIEADNLHDGEKWLAQNHPDMYMGGSVVCENGDFLCCAVPGIDYGKGNYETNAARVAWVKREVAK